MEEEGFGLAVLEAEDLAVTTDVKLALFDTLSVKCPQLSPSCLPLLQFVSSRLDSACNGRIRREGLRQFLPFQGRSSHQRRYRRRYASWLLRKLPPIISGDVDC